MFTRRHFDAHIVQTWHRQTLSGARRLQVHTEAAEFKADSVMLPLLPNRPSEFYLARSSSFIEHGIGSSSWNWLELKVRTQPASERRRVRSRKEADCVVQCRRKICGSLSRVGIREKKDTLPFHSGYSRSKDYARPTSEQRNGQRTFGRRRMLATTCPETDNSSKSASTRISYTGQVAFY